MDSKRARGAIRAVAAMLTLAAATSTGVQAQGRGGGQTAPALTPRAAAPIDLTGTWVSIVTEDWRYRMVTPARGDYQSVPMTPEAADVADAWDPAADEAAGLQCKSYGAPALMRVPGRLRIDWENDRTLRVEMDAGTQTRLFRFDATTATPVPRTWQGESSAEWVLPRGGRGGRGAGAAEATRTGSLKVVTTNLRAGYLRKNGVPYSEGTTLTEHINLVRHGDGTAWLVVTAIVDDPQYLRQPFIVSSHFRREMDGAKWAPTPCSSTW